MENVTFINGKPYVVSDSIYDNIKVLSKDMEQKMLEHSTLIEQSVRCVVEDVKKKTTKHGRVMHELFASQRNGEMLKFVLFDKDYLRYCYFLHKGNLVVITYGFEKTKYNNKQKKIKEMRLL